VNSIVVLNWKDKDFAERVIYSLEKQGYRRTEDYEGMGAQIQVWEKEARNNLRGETIALDPLAPIKLIPADIMIGRIKDRMAVYMPEGSKDWEIDHAATNIVYDLQGKP
jgi:hypothetical protein